MKLCKKIVTLIMLSLFLISSSGILITVHHCCHAHHHTIGDHSHCHNEYHYFKIIDQYDTANTDNSVHHNDAVIEFFSCALVYFCENNIYAQQIHRAGDFPPPIWWQHLTHFLFISQHRL